MSRWWSRSFRASECTCQPTPRISRYPSDTMNHQEASKRKFWLLHFRQRTKRPHSSCNKSTASTLGHSTEGQLNCHCWAVWLPPCSQECADPPQPAPHRQAAGRRVTGLCTSTSQKQTKRVASDKFWVTDRRGKSSSPASIGGPLPKSKQRGRCILERRHWHWHWREPSRLAAAQVTSRESVHWSLPVQSSPRQPLTECAGCCPRCQPAPFTAIRGHRERPGALGGGGAHSPTSRYAECKGLPLGVTRLCGLGSGLGIRVWAS